MSWLDDIDQLDADVGESLGEVAVEYRPSAGGSFDLVGMYDRTYVMQGAGESMLDEQGPSVFLRGTEAEKLPVRPENDEQTLVIDGQEFSAWKRTNDSTTGRGVRLWIQEIN